MNLRSVFRSEDNKQLIFSRNSQDSACSSRHIYNRTQSNRDTEIERDDSSFRVLERLSISRSFAEPNNAQHECFLAESRDPEEHEECSQVDERSNQDCGRTEPSPTRSESDTFFAPRHSFREEDFGSCEQSILNGGLKRANPIYESESEAEHLEQNSHYMKRRRSGLHSGGSYLSTPKPLFWGERLSSE